MVCKIGRDKALDRRVKLRFREVWEMITEKQKNYILYLYKEIDIEPEEDLDNLTKQQASNLIEELKQIKEEIS